MIYFVIMAVVIGIFIGFALGVLSSKVDSPVGSIVINLNDPSKELFEIRFEEDLDKMMNKQFVNFRVVTIDKAKMDK